MLDGRVWLGLGWLLEFGGIFYYARVQYTAKCTISSYLHDLSNS